MEESSTISAPGGQSRVWRRPADLGEPWAFKWKRYKATTKTATEQLDPITCPLPDDVRTSRLVAMIHLREDPELTRQLSMVSLCRGLLTSVQTTSETDIS